MDAPWDKFLSLQKYNKRLFVSVTVNLCLNIRLSVSFNGSSPSDSWDRLRFSPSRADTDWLLGSLAFFEGETISWLNRFLLTFVTSADNRSKRSKGIPFFDASRVKGESQFSSNLIKMTCCLGQKWSNFTHLN